ncbi:MAG: TolC family protein [Acidobacteriota bacterium]|nr:TolC family protein [Acidobacteriota bacterium]
MRILQNTETRNSWVAWARSKQVYGKDGFQKCLAASAGMVVMLIALGLPSPIAAQNPQPPGAGENVLQLAQPAEPGQTSPHITITLQDALDRAQKNDAQYSSAVTEAKMAREDHVQARAAGLPSVAMQTSALLTQGNGAIPSGRYVTNDGVHVYRQWAVVHQDFSLGTLTMLGSRRGAALESLARAKAEIAQRGLKVTVTKDYYALIVSQRRYATAQEGLKQSERFLAMTKDQERQGEAAHSDVIKAQIQVNQQRTVLQDVQLQMENDRLTLAVLLFPTLTENFSVVDDLDQGQSLPPFSDAREMAARENPDLRAAMEAVQESSLGVSAARYAMLPTITTDLDYGIEANAFALRSRVSADPAKGPLPNLGYFATITLNLPVWDWGTLRSKLRQAEYHRQQARKELTWAQRQSMNELYSFYNEAQTAKSTVETLRETASLASEELRLTTLRYQAGQATALEVVDAQSTLSQARNAYDDGQSRFRLALAQLQTLTGSF